MKRSVVLLIVGAFIGYTVLTGLTAATSDSVAVQSYGSVPAQSNGSNSNQSIGVFPFNYYQRDGEDGWSFGYLRIYFMNLEESTINPMNITIHGAVLHTKENHDYPVDMALLRGDVETYRGDPFVMYGGVSSLEYSVTIDISNDGIPSGFPVVKREAYDAEYVLYFRYATAATPVEISLETSLGEIRWDLSQVPSQVPEVVLDENQVADLSELINHFRHDASKVSLTILGECFHEGRSYYIPYEITNLDEFSEVVYNYTVPAILYSTEGDISVPVLGFGIRETLGPGQKNEGIIRFASYVEEWDPQPLYLLVYTNSWNVKIYPVSECKSMS